MEYGHHRLPTPDPSHLVSWVMFIIPSLLHKLGTGIGNSIAIVDLFRLMGVEELICYVGCLSVVGDWKRWTSVCRWCVKRLIHEWSFVSALLVSIWSKSWIVDSCILQLDTMGVCPSLVCERINTRMVIHERTCLHLE